jgi:hypothetical protein
MLTLLEDRLAPAVLTVNSLADGPVSGLSPTLDLREAIALVDSHGAATDSSGRSLAAAKTSQIDTTEPFGSMDVIRFDSNLFGPAQQVIALDGQLLLEESVTILGPGSSLLAVSGGGQTSLFQIACGASANLSRLTIEDGSSTAPGGGILNKGMLTVADSAISGNSAYQGGGIANYGVLTLVDSDVSDNSAASSGGGILNKGTLAVLGSAVADNEAQLNNGGIVNNGGAVMLVDSVVSGNLALVGNGGLANYGGTMTLVASAVSGNAALAAGGIGNYDGTLTIRDSSISGNAATTDGGGGILNTGTLTITGSDLTGNRASLGGAINNTGAASLVDTDLSGNWAGGQGGGIFNYYGSLALADSAVADNSAAISGGGILSNGTVRLVNSTVSGNSSLVEDGGILNYGGRLTLVDSTVFGNSADLVGIGNPDSTLTPANNRVDANPAGASNNDAPNFGGAIEPIESSVAALALQGGDAGNPSNIYPSSETTSARLRTLASGIIAGSSDPEGDSYMGGTFYPSNMDAGAFAVSMAMDTVTGFTGSAVDALGSRPTSSTNWVAREATPEQSHWNLVSTKTSSAPGDQSPLTENGLIVQAQAGTSSAWQMSSSLFDQPSDSPEVGDATLLKWLGPKNGSEKLTAPDRRLLAERHFVQFEAVPFLKWEQDAYCSAQATLVTVLAALWVEKRRSREPGQTRLRLPVVGRCGPEVA